MKRLLTLATIFAITALFGFVVTDDASAQAAGGKFGKGQVLHQYGPFDDDGDGIPNYQDPDHVKRLDGTGPKFGKLNGGARALNGKRGGFGPGNGSGNNGIGPRDGTGFGAGKGTGVCDGTGPKGGMQRRGR